MNSERIEKIILIICILALVPLVFTVFILREPPAKSVEQESLLENAGFEDGTWFGTLYWLPSGGPYSDWFGNISPPAHWIAWWREGFACTSGSTFVTGRPEARVIGTTDPVRVYEGTQAAQMFTFWRCHDMGLMQTVDVVTGTEHMATVMAHAWYSNCSTKPHDGPLESDCRKPVGWANDYLSIGIDPMGGLDPLAESVIWSQEQEIYGVYSSVLSVSATAETGRMTIFLRSRTDQPLKHEDVYWDSVELWEVRCKTYLPLAIN